MNKLLETVHIDPLLFVTALQQTNAVIAGSAILWVALELNIAGSIEHSTSPSSKPTEQKISTPWFPNDLDIWIPASANRKAHEELWIHTLYKSDYIFKSAFTPKGHPSCQQYNRLVRWISRGVTFAYIGEDSQQPCFQVQLLFLKHSFSEINYSPLDLVSSFDLQLLQLWFSMNTADRELIEMKTDDSVLMSDSGIFMTRVALCDIQSRVIHIRLHTSIMCDDFLRTCQRIIRYLSRGFMFHASDHQQFWQQLCEQYLYAIPASMYYRIRDWNDSVIRWAKLYNVSNAVSHHIPHIRMLHAVLNREQLVETDAGESLILSSQISCPMILFIKHSSLPLARCFSNVILPVSHITPSIMQQVILPVVRETYGSSFVTPPPDVGNILCISKMQQYVTEENHRQFEKLFRSLEQDSHLAVYMHLFSKAKAKAYIEENDRNVTLQHSTSSGTYLLFTTIEQLLSLPEEQPQCICYPSSRLPCIPFLTDDDKQNFCRRQIFEFGIRVTKFVTIKIDGVSLRITQNNFDNLVRTFISNEDNGELGDHIAPHSRQLKVEIYPKVFHVFCVKTL